VSQQHNLGFQSRLRLEWRDQDVDEQDQERDHRALSLSDLAAHASPDEVLGMDREQQRAAFGFNAKPAP
jgi:hypothetical protein